MSHGIWCNPVCGGTPIGGGSANVSTRTTSAAAPLLASSGDETASKLTLVALLFAGLLLAFDAFGIIVQRRSAQS
jgi:hypothetical protein